jgi:hypothetical protein
MGQKTSKGKIQHSYKYHRRRRTSTTRYRKLLKAIKIKWIKNIDNENVIAPWKSYLSTKIAGNIHQMPTYNYAPSDYPKFKDNFYNELLHTWAKMHLITPENAQEISEQPLWHNTHIKVNWKTIEFTRWKEKGINYIQDIINKKGEILKKKDLNSKYGNICKYLEYESLTSAIKK